MSTLVQVWDPKGEPFEVPSQKLQTLLAVGWSQTKPTPAVVHDLFTDVAPSEPKKRKFSKLTGPIGGDDE